MAADISEVVRATAPEGNQFGIGVFIDINLVKSIIAVIFYPKNNISCEFIMFNQFYIT
jgi:hypothetical protein